jgi:hypothetical protein
METIRHKVLGLMVYVQTFPAACLEDWQFDTHRGIYLYILDQGAALKENTFM